MEILWCSVLALGGMHFQIHCYNKQTLGMCYVIGILLYFSNFTTLDPLISEHHGTRGSSDMQSVWICETIYFLLEQIGILFNVQLKSH